ncbi:MAG: amidohydrolase family protein, partial [Rubripirellula sp.]
MSSDDHVFHARWIIPISSEPINGGWVRVQRGRIVETGSGRGPTGDIDLGDVALLPQLINTHTHLEFSDCRCPIGTPGMPLAQWIGEVVAARSRSTESNRDHVIELGLQELVAAGTCLAAEITTPPSNYAATEGQLSLVTFAEVLGLNQERADERFAAADTHCQLEGEAGISPHAPYSTSIEVIMQCIAYARDQRRPLAMHVAESPG